MGFVLDKSNDLTGIFHLLIIAMFFLVLSGCGYKAAPFYKEDVSNSDIKFVKTVKE